MVKLIYANTKNADMSYAVKADIHDPFFFLEIDEQSYIFLDLREYDAFLEKNKNQQINTVLLNSLIKESQKVTVTENSLFKLALFILQKYNLTESEILVPASFPLDLADFLRSQNIKIKPINPFYSEREYKTDNEIKFIQENIKNTCKAFSLIEDILKESIITNNKIYYDDNILTSEFLKNKVEELLLKDDLILSEGIIISSGRQAAMPHHSGANEVLPNQPIICDIFPKSRINGYFADMTRTYFKGKPVDELFKMYQAVKDVQEKAISTVSAGVSGKDIHQVSLDGFTKQGFDIGDKGFVHGTGHGLGLEIHELPFVNAEADKNLQAGNIITIEPGLYYPDLGGIRIEDVVAVTAEGSLNLTNYSKDIKIF